MGYHADDGKYVHVLKKYPPHCCSLFSACASVIETHFYFKGNICIESIALSSDSVIEVSACFYSALYVQGKQFNKN